MRLILSTDVGKYCALMFVNIVQWYSPQWHATLCSNLALVFAGTVQCGRAAIRTERYRYPLNTRLGSRVGLKALANRKYLPLRGVEPRFPGRPTCILVTIATERARVPELT
jgi:hypothetical protein